MLNMFSNCLSTVAILRGCSKWSREKMKLFEIDINGMKKRLFSIEEEKKSSLLSERQCRNCCLAFMNWGLNDIGQLILFERKLLS